MIHRKNGEFATQATLIQSAIGSVLDKEGAKAFKKTIEDLIAEGDDDGDS